jgi:hypothetical protein
MSIARFLTTPCTITNPSTNPDDTSTDAEGIPSSALTTVDTLCHVQPYTTSASDRGDLLLGGDEVRRARRAWFPANTDLRFTSTVTVGSDTYDVAGDPDTWQVGSTSDHIAAVLVRQLRPEEAAS